MAAMTNHTLLDHRTGMDPDLLALAPVGRTRRAVKLVQHPAFRAARARAAFDAPFTVLRLPVVSLNDAASARSCAADLPTVGAA